MATKPDLSIVICFRDWGLDRLSTAVRSHFLNASGLTIDVIVSDYGSKNADEIRDTLTPLGARVIRTQTSLPWSRSASLNAGIVHARSDFVVTTDADIIFSPDCYTEAVRLLKQNPDALYLVQCRDLSPQFGAAQIDRYFDRNELSTFWSVVNKSAVIRPRWGMGGFAAFTLKAFSDINGYEERMKIWGGEDNDFAMRFRRAGRPLRWLSNDSSRIFHVWHEPSQSKANETPEGRCAIQLNREILKQDESLVRNRRRYLMAARDEPAVTIVIPTYKRPELLADCLRSCLSQTVSNFEILVIENGDSSGADVVVKSFQDKRLRYLKTERKGAAAARNVGVAEARGRFIAIHDDDDLMVSTRLEDHLRAYRPGLAGTYAGWIDFEHGTSDVLGRHPGKEFNYAALLCNGKVLTHGALMLDRRLFSLFQYQEALSAGIDYGFMLLLARNGLKLAHTGTYGILRRMHSTNMTRVNVQEQKSAAVTMANLLKGEIPEAEYPGIRKAGLAAKELPCSNELSAVEELSTLHGADASGPCPEFSTLEEMDAWLYATPEAVVKSVLPNIRPVLRTLLRSRLAMLTRRASLIRST